MDRNKEIEEALECPVCLALPSVENKPRILPCLHTLCDGCVRDLVGRACKVDPGSWGFECPVCRALCDVPVHELQTDMTAIRMIEALKTKVSLSSAPLKPPRAPNGPGLAPSEPSVHIDKEPAVPRETHCRGVEKEPSEPTESVGGSGEKPAQPGSSKKTPNGEKMRFAPLEIGGHRHLENKVFEKNPVGPTRPVLKAIPGNWATNPFLNRAVGAAEPETSPVPALPPKRQHCPTPERPMRPAPLPPPTPSGPPDGPNKLYVALYDYRPTRPDELELKKGELYDVTAKCADNWFKGTSKRTLKSGSMPGNYLQRVTQGVPSRASAPLPATKTTELVRPGSREETVETPPSLPRGLGRFVAVEEYPASDQDELDLRLGDELVMTEKRTDGWCRGVLVASGKSGAFPFSFVKMKP